jgi:hypothetical protein
MRRTPEEQAQARILEHPYGDCVAELLREESLVTRPMFGALACYVHGRLALVLAAGEPPWDGMLVPTAREHHDRLRADVPELRVHPVLGKWLYLPASTDGFEREARRLASLARADDPRVGVEPKPRRRRPAGGSARPRRPGTRRRSGRR